MMDKFKAIPAFAIFPRRNPDGSITVLPVYDTDGKWIERDEMMKVAETAQAEIDRQKALFFEKYI
jgi:hypothetical protein